LTPESDLEFGLGLSSLERVELLSALEDRYQIDISETNFAKATTVAELEKLLQSTGGGGNRNSHSAAPPRELPSVFHYPRWVLRWPVTWLRVAAQYLLIRPAVFLLGRPSIIGRENLRGHSGPLLIASNHISDVDFGLIQYALPSRLGRKVATATAGEALEKLRSPAASQMFLARSYNRVRWALAVALLNLFPLPRESAFRKSFAYAGEAVDRGYSVLVFPEGKHTEDGGLGAFRTGVGLLANNLHIPILPMRIDGLFELKKDGKKFAPSGKIKVRIGRPIKFAPETNPEEITRALKDMVENLRH
jgi:long-chain acyl-CoA synthetase